MKVKNTSMLVKFLLVLAGFALCILHWCGVLPDAEIKEIWYSISFAYGVSLGTIDFNICRDNWIESKESTGGSE